MIGARPQFVKAAAVSRELRKHAQEILVHTGQHYDYNMSRAFFDELGLPDPDYNLGVGSGSHGYQTGQMLQRIEEVLVTESPDWVIVYGDTNSTLAGAVAAAKLHIPVAHVEAGLRSYNRRMPEEINRVLTDHVSELLFAPTETAVQNLAREGIVSGVYRVGDVMCDVLSSYAPLAAGRTQLLDRLGVVSKKYLLLTIHRAENTEDPERLRRILGAICGCGKKVVFPVHPRTRNALVRFGLSDILAAQEFVDTAPVGYLDMLCLEANAEKVLTDSGGVQKEAYLLGVPCVTLRAETEWVETVNAGWNTLVDDSPHRIREAIEQRQVPLPRPPFYGSGSASLEIVGRLLTTIAHPIRRWEVTR